METTEQGNEKIFYQDNNVTITQSQFIAGSKTYAIRNISSASNYEIKKSKTGAILLLVIGFFLSIPEPIRILGWGLIIIGVIWLIKIEGKYSVRISTDSGEENSFIHHDKAYIQKIVNALNDAIIHKV
jgi:hypothetical protein